MRTQIHLIREEDELRVEVQRMKTAGGLPFIVVSFDEKQGSGVDIFLRSTTDLHKIVAELALAEEKIKQEEQDEQDAVKGEALKAAIHAALDRKVQERAEEWRAPMRAMLEQGAQVAPTEGE